MNKRRLNRQLISQQQISQLEWDRYCSQNKAYYCTNCSKALLTEDIVSIEELKAYDKMDLVKFIVGYSIQCKNNLTHPFYDSSHVFSCFLGDDKCTRSCQTCIYAEPHVIHIQSGVLRDGNAKKWGKAPRKDLRVTRTVYLCKNLDRMEHFNVGTYMSAYIRCEHYKNKGDVGIDVENK